MSDKRSRRQKLEAMARQSVSPNEAEIARAKLRQIPPDPEPWRASFRTSEFHLSERDMEAMFRSGRVRRQPPDRTRASREFHDFVQMPGPADQTCDACGLGRFVGLHRP